MSKVYKCDGCGSVWENSPTFPRGWHRVEIDPNETGAIEGDFCSLNCLAKYIANGRLGQIIRESGL